MGNEAKKFGKIYQSTGRNYRQFYTLKVGPVNSSARMVKWFQFAVSRLKTLCDANRRQGFTIWEVPKILEQT